MWSGALTPLGGAGGPAFRAGWQHCEQNSGCEARPAQKKPGQQWGQIPSSLVTLGMSGSLCAPRTQASPEVASLGRRGRAGGAGDSPEPPGGPLAGPGSRSGSGEAHRGGLRVLQGSPLSYLGKYPASRPAERGVKRCPLRRGRRFVTLLK